MTTLSGDTATVAINTPGRWLVLANASFQDAVSGNLAVNVTWIGNTNYISWYHDRERYANTANVTFMNIINVSGSYSNTMSFDNITASLQVNQQRWLAVKIGPAS